MNKVLKFLYPLLSIIIGASMIDTSITNDFDYSSWCGFGGFILISIGLLRGYHETDKLDENQND